MTQGRRARRNEPDESTTCNLVTLTITLILTQSHGKQVRAEQNQRPASLVRSQQRARRGPLPPGGKNARDCGHDDTVPGRSNVRECRAWRSTVMVMNGGRRLATRHARGKVYRSLMPWLPPTASLARQRRRVRAPRQPPIRALQAPVDEAACSRGHMSRPGQSGPRPSTVCHEVLS